MFSKISSAFYRKSAWRLALASTLVFAVGSAAVFLAMYFVMARAVQTRSDAWLIGESETLRQVALATPHDALYDHVLEEVAEHASREVSHDGSGRHNTVFFAETGGALHASVWVGPPDRAKFLAALLNMRAVPGKPVSLRIPGWPVPFRVVAAQTSSAEGRIYLGLLDSAAAALMSHLLMRFTLGWICMVALGFLVTVLGLRRMLNRVEAIAGAAASIRSDDLSTRVPVARHRDEVARLALTFNNMLDRVSSTVNQLRTLTDSMAHDLKSPITAVRGSLEIALSMDDHSPSSELVAGAIEQLDRLSEVITTSLDLAEAESGALRLRLTRTDVGELAERVTQLYAPAFAEKRQQLSVTAASPLFVEIDVSLCTRMLSNLMENELHYAGSGSEIRVTVSASRSAAYITIEDSGPGFPAELMAPAMPGQTASSTGERRLFQRFVKGRQSTGHGLGLAFVNAVAVAHGGRASARNRSPESAPHGGAQIVIELPLAGRSAGAAQDLSLAPFR
jgi:signal transduction histidine kinase